MLKLHYVYQENAQDVENKYLGSDMRCNAFLKYFFWKCLHAVLLTMTLTVLIDECRGWN